jgi:DNA invertase Pin-like site-specific DNA recombinase
VEAAVSAGIDLSGFDSKVPAEERILWARGRGLSVGAVYTRYSTPRQRSTRDQVRACVEFAAAKKVFVPPEFICIDEGKSGRKSRRKGLQRMLAILREQALDVFLTFMLSRLFRKAHQCYRFVDEEVVERGIRAICVADNIDTNDKGGWKLLVSIKGAMDEAQVETTAEQVRNAQVGLFHEGFVTGALPVGFRRRIVPEARLTNRGLPRAVPEVDPDAAKLIRQHMEWIAEGMPIIEGWRRWVAANGPCDPRATGGRMALESYRRLISNEKLIGIWKFGQKRSTWSSKRDYTRQIPQPEASIKVARYEHLRIVDDELFFRVQERLRQGTRGRHKVRRKEGRPVVVWDLVTDIYHCPDCQHRFQQRGEDGQSMACANDECKRRGMVRRREAFRAVAAKLEELLSHDQELLDQCAKSAIARDGKGDEECRAQIAEEQRQIEKLGRKIDLLVEIASENTAGNREEEKAKIRLAKQERAGHQMRLAQLMACEQADRKVLTVEEVRAVLAEFRSLLERTGSGEAGPEVVYKAAEAFRALTDGRIMVHFDPRLGRKRTVARGVFVPALLKTVQQKLGLRPAMDGLTASSVEVWLRKPPQLDAMAEQVRQMYEVEKLGFREIGDRLGCGSGNACLAYRRAYEMRGLPLPERRTNLGRPRKAG